MDYTIIKNKSDISHGRFLQFSKYEKCGNFTYLRDFLVRLADFDSVVVPYWYLFLLSVFILWFSYYVSDTFYKF